MRFLLLAELRFLLRAPWSAATAVFGVALAVASIVAVHQIGAAVSRSLDAAWPPHLAGITHLLERPGLTAAGYFELREDWREAGWSGVNALVPVVEGYVRFQGRSVRVLGADWLAYPVRSAGDSRAERTSLPVWGLLDGAAALADRSLGLAAGESAMVRDTRVEIADLIDGLGPTLVTDIATAQRLLGRDADAVDYIGVAARDRWARWRVALDALMPGIAAGLPGSEVPQVLRAAGFEARAVASEQPAAEFARAILFNVGALGLLALLVAWFLVHQVALIWVERQRPLFARLHALGVTYGTLGIGFIALFVLLGLLATLCGTAAGLWLAEILIRVSAPGAGGDVASVGLEPILLVKAAGAGIGVCAAGGAVAFRSDVREARHGVWPRVVLAVVAGGALVGGLLADGTGLLGGFAAILAASLLALAAIQPVLRGVRAGLGRTAPRRGRALRRPAVSALLVRLAVREAVARPQVVSVALAALALAVATSIGVGLMVESLRVEFTRMLENRLAGDLYLRASPATIASVAGWLATERGTWRVGHYGELRVRVARADGALLRSGAASRDPLATVGPAAPVSANTGNPALLGYGVFDATESSRYGYGAPLAPDEVLVNERLARLLGIGSGDRLTVGRGVFTVAGVFPGFGDSEPRLMMDVDGLAALGRAPLFDRLAIQRPLRVDSELTMRRMPEGGTAGHAGESLRALSRALTERFPELEVIERETLRQRAHEVFDRTFATTHALTLLALLVAGVGVYNALTALRLAQAPTRRLLVAQGAAAGELALVALIRSATIGTLAVAVALPLGIAMAWMLCQVVNPRGFGWTIELHLVPGGLLVPVALGLAATLLAGILPAPHERGELDDTV